MPKYFISDGEYIYVNAEYAEAYIPKDLFHKVDEKVPETAIAYEYGNAFMALGIFYMRFFDSDTEPRTSKPLKTFCYPNTIETHPTSNVTADIELNGEVVTCRVLKYYKGDIMMNAMNTRSVSNCEKFMAFLCSGRVPRALSYWDIFAAWEANFTSNDIDPGVPSVVLQGFISKMCRSNTDVKTEFRKVIGNNPDTDPHDYIPLSMNQMSANSSVMSSLSFERFGEKLTSALIMSEEGLPQEQSPIEKVLVM